MLQHLFFMKIHNISLHYAFRKCKHLTLNLMPKYIIQYTYTKKY